MRALLTAAIVACASSVGGVAAAQSITASEPPDFWSRVTLAVPVATVHTPHNSDFNNENWGLLADVALNDRWSLVGGGFRNSYGRNTALAGVAWQPLSAQVGAARLRFGGMVGADLNGGYKRFNSADPLIAAFNVRLTAAEPDGRALSRLGLLLTVIPPAPKNGATAFNLAVTYRLR